MKCFVLFSVVWMPLFTSIFLKKDKIKEKFGILSNMAGLHSRTVKQK